MRVLALTIAAALAGCSQAPEADDTEVAQIAMPVRQVAPNSQTAAGTPFDVPSDANARYALLKVESGEGDNIVATTRREGPSGTSFARREIACGAQTYRYIGEGDTLDEANKPAPNPGEMATLVDGSISDVAVKFACASR